tara:strand:- start:347 stop:1420 length:1074 start_codon:yes stop_codon:yes gene_type:complete
MKKASLTLSILLLLFAGSVVGKNIKKDLNTKLKSISSQFIFADMHAHPSRFHRSNLDSISEEEINRYKLHNINVVVASISTDMAYEGNYDTKNGKVPRGKYKPSLGQSFTLTFERFQRIQNTFTKGSAVHASSPSSTLKAKEKGELAIIPAMEGADGLEGSIENLHTFYDMGLRLIQLVHFRANALGHVQSHPYSPGGLTAFGKEVVEESNRLNLIIDIAHANTETIRDVLKVSKDPVIFSHGGLKALRDQDRALTDEEVILIAEKGGVVGIWPHGRYIESVDRMVDYIDHVIDLVGPDHVGIASDLRGVSKYSKGFGKEANFSAIAKEMIIRGHDDETVGKVMGGNFFRLWQEVSR